MSITFRTDRNNNPTAFTTDIARLAGLIPDKEYVQGESFQSGTPLQTFYTAKLIGDPIEITIRVIDKIGFYTSAQRIRWVYIGLPKFVWEGLLDEEKKQVIQFMYHREGGTQMEHLFA